jgi:hypothetical protein
MINHRFREGRPAIRFARVAAIVLTVLCLALSVWTPGISYAGKEGVFINGSAYFTLEEVSISKGSDTQMMRFNVKLNNDGESTVDFNHYGIKVTSTSGGSYYAQLSQTANALVSAHSSASYYYVATIPGALDSSQLKVTVFERNGTSLTDVGSLSVANAGSVGQQANQLLLNLSDVDTALSTNAFVSFQAVKAVAIPQDGKWSVLVDATVTPTGAESITLPAAMKYILHDGEGRAMVMTSNAIDGSSLNAGQTKHVLLTVALDTLPSIDSLSLQLSGDSAGITSYGNLSLAPLFQSVQVGERVPYLLSGREGVTLEVQKAEQQQVNNKKQALITAVIHNDSKSTLTAPTIQGTLVSQTDTISVKTDTIVTPETYIASGASGIYRFAAQVPDGTSAESLQFLISEPRSGSSSTASSSQSTTATSSSTGAASGISAGNTGSTTGSTTDTTAVSTTGTTSTAANTTSTAANTTAAAATTTGSQTTASAASQTGAIPLLVANLTGGLTSLGDMSTITAYQLGQTFVFDTGSRLIDPKLDISVVELNGHTNADNGYQTVVAKFKLLNKSSETLALPAFDTSMTDTTGTSYPGTRQTTTLQTLIPNSGYVYSYTYMLPPSANGSFKLSILDSSNSSNIKVPIANYMVNVSQTGEEDSNALEKTLSLYPFSVKIEDWNLSSVYSSEAYTYKIKLGLDIKKVEEVIVDDSFSTLEFEMVDGLNRVLGSTTQKLQGTGKLMSGSQTISLTDIKSEQLDYPLTMRIYEDIVTSTGTARRLVATFKQ